MFGKIYFLLMIILEMSMDLEGVGLVKLVIVSAGFAAGIQVSLFLRGPW